MNLDFALVNRALRNIGMAPLIPADKDARNEAWLTAKEYYLATMLEALAQVEWTSAKRRRELTPAQMPCKGNPDFAFVYSLSIDCAKPVELDGQEPFEVEGDLLFTDAAPARLLYVSNGKRLCQNSISKTVTPGDVSTTVVSAGSTGRRPVPDYLTGGDAGRGRRLEWGDGFISGGNARRVLSVPEEEDYPEYRELRLEPNFYLYWECLLSSKYALRLTDKPDLSMIYFNKAVAIGKGAEVVSIEHSAGRLKAEESWQDELGLR